MFTLELVVVSLASLCVVLANGQDLSQVDTSQRARPAQQNSRNRNYWRECTRAQSNIDFRELMGLWSVIEVIEHSERYSDRRNYLRAVSRSDTCPVVHFALDEDREVRMLWNDESGYVQFSFRMTNINNPGFWMSIGYQTGTMVDNNYEHFSGTAQVMKAVQSHMVLTFCAPHEKHFSIILSRGKHLSYEEVTGVHKQLSRVNLPLVAVQSYCKNAGVSTSPSLAIAAIIVAVLCTRTMTLSN